MFPSVKSLISNKNKDSSEDALAAKAIERSHETKDTVKKNLPLFEPNLVKELENDHQEIMFLYKYVLQCAENKDYTELSEKLEKFSSTLINHIHKEDNELYSYIKSLASYNGSIEERVCGEFIAEMKKITISMFYTLNQNPYVPVNDDNVEEFTQEFKGLGTELQDRMSREERIIYPMYENSRRVIDIS